MEENKFKFPEWWCNACGYMPEHEGEDPPDKCHVCGSIDIKFPPEDDEEDEQKKF